MCEIYKLAKYGDDVLNPYYMLSGSQINGTFDFTRILQSVEPEKDEIAVSFDVKSLHTRMLVRNDLDLLHSSLISDASLEKQCSLTPPDITIEV